MAPRFVVGVDGSDASRKALTWASRAARVAEASLEIVMAWHYPVTAMTTLGAAIPMPAQASMQERAEESLRTLAGQCQTADGVDLASCEQIAVEGYPGRVLCDVATNADLLIVGSRGLGGFSGLVLGSVSAHCANAAPCPVAIVPTEWDPDATPPGRVVVGVDDSENAREAVRWADAWVRPGVTLHLISAWNYPLAFGSAGLEIERDVLEEGCQELVSAAAALVTSHEVTTQCTLGDARTILPTEAADAEMLVIGSRGHSGLSRLILGSVASSLIHHLVTPTVVVPGRD